MKSSLSRAMVPMCPRKKSSLRGKKSCENEEDYLCKQMAIIQRLDEDIQEKYDKVPFRVAILGGGGKRSLSDRKKIAEKLKELNILGIIPEIHFRALKQGIPVTREIGYLEDPVIDMILIIVESEGPLIEWMKFVENENIRKKMWLLVDIEYSPFYKGSKSRMSIPTQEYLEQMVKYGLKIGYYSSKRECNIMNKIDAAVQISKAERDMRANMLKSRRKRRSSRQQIGSTS